MAEVIVVMGLLTLLSLILAFALKQSSAIWVASAGRQDANQTIQKVSLRLEKDFPMVSQEALGVTAVPASMGGGVDGDAIWFLSHINPVDGRPYLKADGTPFWQCNVIYYSVIPEDVQELASRTIQVGETDGYEDRCPYKVLVRKVVDIGSPTDTTDEATEETLMTPDQVSDYLTRPAKLDLSAMRSEPNLLDLELVGYPILLFRASPSDSPEGVQFDLRVVALEKAERAARGGRSLINSSATTRSELFIETHN